MSRGYGKLQRQILEAIEEHRTADIFTWRGGEIVDGEMFCVCDGYEFIAPDDLIDIRAVSEWMADDRSHVASLRIGTIRTLSDLLVTTWLDRKAQPNFGCRRGDGASVFARFTARRTRATP